MVEERALIREGRPTPVAENLPSAQREKPVFLVVVEACTVRVHRFAGDLFDVNVDTNVMAECPTTGDDDTTLQALVTIALMILKHRSNFKFIRSFTVKLPVSNRINTLFNLK